MLLQQEPILQVFPLFWGWMSKYELDPAPWSCTRDTRRGSSAPACPGWWPWWRSRALMGTAPWALTQQWFPGQYPILHPIKLNVVKFEWCKIKVNPYFTTSMYNPCTFAPSRGGEGISSLVNFFVTSQTRHILSRGSSFFLAVLCIIAVRKDWGLKKPGSQTDEGRLKSAVHPSSSLILRSKSAYHADKPFRES